MGSLSWPRSDLKAIKHQTFCKTRTPDRPTDRPGGGGGEIMIITQWLLERPGRRRGAPGGNGTGCTKVLRAGRWGVGGWGQVKVACWALDPAPPRPPSVINSLHQAGSRAGRRQVASQRRPPPPPHPLCLAAAVDKAKGRWGGWFLLVVMVVGSVEGGGCGGVKKNA